MSKSVGALVIDTGSTFCKVGYAGSKSPQTTFPSVIGRPKNGVIMKGIENAQEVYAGRDALVMRGVLDYSYPIDRGSVNNWDDMTKIWEHALIDILHFNPIEHSILLADAPGNPKEDRETAAQTFFETFSVPSLYIGYQPVLSLHSANQSTGVVVSSGDGVTDVSAVYEGYLVQNSHQRLKLGGNDVSERLQGLLEKKGSRFATQEERAAVDKFKESLAYVALDYKAECKTAADSFQQRKLYELPDGTTVVLREELFGATEGVFQPTLHGLNDIAGIHSLVHRCIESCDTDFSHEMYANIVLSGGNTLFPGFPERLHKEVTLQAPHVTKINIVAPMNRKDSAWIGGSVLASHSSFSSLCVSKAEYEEVGPAVVHSKFL